MTPVAIRAATSDDLPAIGRIYNHYVAELHVTFDTEPYSIAALEDWFNHFAARGPHRLFVAETEGKIVGYASSKKLRPHAAYDSSVETSVYVHPDDVGQGVGRVLYGALLNVLQAEPTVHRAYGIIGLPNPTSVALHERCGFRLVGTLHQAGRKFGNYWDVGWYEKDVSGTQPSHSV